MSNMSEKELKLGSNICKISIFQEIGLNFTYSQKFEFFKTNCFYPLNSMAVAREEFSFSILSVVNR